MIWKWRNILKIKWIQYISSSKPLINPTRTSFTNLSEKNYIKHFFYKFLYGCDYCKCRNVITEFSVRHFPILFRLYTWIVVLDIAITVGGAACNAVDSASDNMPCYEAIFILRARDHVSLTSLANKSSYYHYSDIF